MRADELRRELQEIVHDEPAPRADAAAVVARGKRRLLRRRFGVGFVLVAVLGVSVGIAASARDGSPKGVVIAPTPTANAGPQVMFTSDTDGWVCGDPILHTADGGQHWLAQAYPELGRATCAAVPTEAWIFVQQADGSVIVLPADGGIHVVVGFPALPAGATVAQATFVDKDHGWVLVRPAGNPVGHGLLYRTTTGTPRPIGFELVSSAAPIGQVAFVSATEGWGIDGGSIMYTRDGGATWSAKGASLNTGKPHGSWFGIAVHGTTVVAAGPDPNEPDQVIMWVTSDRGRVSGAIPGPKVTGGFAGPSQLQLISAAEWRLMVGGRLWATNDRHDWTEIAAPSNLASMSFPSIESNWVTDTSGAVYRWSDAGPKWERVDTTPQPDWQTNLVSFPDNPGGCPTVSTVANGTLGNVGAVQPSPQQAAYDFVRATRGWSGEKLVASYPVTQPGGQFGPLFAANVPRQCGQAVADASYAVELTNPAIQDSSRSTALVVAPIDGVWKVWGFYR